MVYKGSSTLSVHLSHKEDPQTGAIMPPISLSTTFAQSEPGKPIGSFEYSRSQNPTRQQLEQGIAKLEGASWAFAFSSGSAAIATIGHLLKPGDHVISIDDVYGGSKRYLNQILGAQQIDCSFMTMHRIPDILKAVKSNTKFIWIETPTNPTMAITDIKAVCEQIKKEHPNLYIIVDNTFLTPVLQKPLELGADISSYSATKYINGHCDVVMGLVCTNNQEIAERLQWLQNAIGAVPSPFDCFMVMRGMRTLALRMKAHCQNAQMVAEMLDKHPKVSKVFYPGLETHPQKHTADKQQSGYGGMVSFTIKSTTTAKNISQESTDAVRRFCQACKLFVLAESLGGVESLIDVPAVMTHSGVDIKEREALGISDAFIRLSVGIEDGEDLLDDLRQALDQV